MSNNNSQEHNQENQEEEAVHFEEIISSNNIIPTPSSPHTPENPTPHTPESPELEWIYPLSPNSPFDSPSPPRRHNPNLDPTLYPISFLQPDEILTDLNPNDSDGWFNRGDNIDNPVACFSGGLTRNNPLPTQGTDPNDPLATHDMNPPTNQTTLIPFYSSRPITQSPNHQPPNPQEELGDIDWEEEMDISAILDLGGWVHKGY